MQDAGDEIRRAVAALVEARGQRAVAEAIGVSQPTVSRLLSGERPLSLRLAGGLARAYPELRELVDGVIYGGDAGRPRTPAAAS